MDTRENSVKMAQAFDEGAKAGIKEVVDELAYVKVCIIGTEETKKVWCLVDDTKLKEWGIYR